MQIPQQGHHTGHVRGGHRGAALRRIRVIARRAEDIHPGGREIDARGAEIGEDSALIVVVGGGHGNHVVQIVAGRIERDGVVVLTDPQPVSVTGGGQEDMPGVAGIRQGVVHGL